MGHIPYYPGYMGGWGHDVPRGLAMSGMVTLIWVAVSDLTIRLEIEELELPIGQGHVASPS